MIIFRRKPGDPPWPPIEVCDENGELIAELSDKREQPPATSKRSFVPPKPIVIPLPGENPVSYGDRLLWHQLGLQINGRSSDMLSEDEYVATVCGFYPEALEHNVRAYRSYFNSRQDTMGFRNIEMPVPVTFAEGNDVSN